MHEIKPRTVLVGVALVASALAVAVIIYVAFSKPPSPDSVTLPEEVPPVTTGEYAELPSIVPETVPASRNGWRTYTSTAYKFKVSYPSGYEAREYKEADGAMSLTVQNASTGEGFQLYVTPYAENQVTEERFRLDTSSGIMKDPVDVVIAGVRGTMFWSKNSIMGETREVWFINHGFLYEAVTYKHLDTWLAEVMQTWEFL